MEMKTFGDFATLKSVELKNPDMKRQIFYGKDLMLVLNTFPPHTVVPAHKHPHEQLTYVLSGQCDIKIGEETTHLGPGGIAWAPSDVMHEVVVGDETAQIFDIFNPIREDFLPLFQED